METYEERGVTSPILDELDERIAFEIAIKHAYEDLLEEQKPCDE